MRKSGLILKLVAAGYLVFAVLGGSQPATAYRQCTPQENSVCSQMGGPKVVCSNFHYCFQNSCFAKCSGFTTNCSPADDQCRIL
jgi:hypothetical protein